MKFYVPNWDVRMSRNSVRGEENPVYLTIMTVYVAMMEIGVGNHDRAKITLESLFPKPYGQLPFVCEYYFVAGGQLTKDLHNRMMTCLETGSYDPMTMTCADNYPSIALGKIFDETIDMEFLKKITSSADFEEDFNHPILSRLECLELVQCFLEKLVADRNLGSQ